MRFFSVLSLGVLLFPAPTTQDSSTINPVVPAVVSTAEAAQGWLALCDARTAFGWTPRGDANWTVANGEIVATGGTAGFLCTNTEFADFELKCEAWLDARANSGVFVRAPLTGELTTANAYEVNLNDAHKEWPSGSINTVAKTRTPVKTVGKWTPVVVRAEGDHLTVSLDGRQTVDVHNSSHRRGVIGLQSVGGGTVKFRKVMLRPLSLKSLFNGKDLSGWKVVPGHPSTYSVTPEGWMRVQNGNGEIQSESTWGDFVFQMEILSNGKHLNSGVFFRSEPGQFWRGYESQIRNQWEGDDRSKPVDFGTGGLYNRVASRRVVSSDGEWFTKTIVATGKHIAIWINGFQTVDFTDPRPENQDNAREGARTRAGVFGLQGHDPTTDLSFRNIRVVEYPQP